SFKFPAGMHHVASFEGNVIVLGYGTIGQCALPLLLKHFQVPASRFLVLDKTDHSLLLGQQLQPQPEFLRHEITRDNLATTLGQVAAAGDLLINLSVGIDSIELADWCHHTGVLYVDTSIEPWEDAVWDNLMPASERTEYAYHQRARQQAQAEWASNGPTAVMQHGANPGLVSHFTKAALLNVARATNLDLSAPSSRQGWANLAFKTGTKVIHISERDTQVSSTPKRPNEFVNTWSIPGFVEEAMMPVEIGWGTHERTLPSGAKHHEGGQILGLALPHSESITISDFLTLNKNGQVIYRPTVAFSYLPCDGAMASLHETMMRGGQMQADERILIDEITAGQDELGVLLLGHGLTGWWYGSQLDIQEARRLVPYTNPTALQVAAGAVSAAVWAAANPNQGYCEPEDLPHEDILEIARPYLGTIAACRPIGPH
ncbi:MAG: saccharopine dehydrogenase NADP-binding domain-containing protein, partial [Planctomycetota bacterium]